MADQDSDKSQDATPHRRQQAREQGQVARSQDLGSAAVLLGSVVGLMWLGPDLVNYLAVLTRRQLGGDPWMSADVSFTTYEWHSVAWGLGKVMLPILGLVTFMAIASNVLQVGLLFLPDKLAPDISRIDPLKGFGRLFSLTNFVRLVFGIIKVIIVAAVAYASLKGHHDEILAASGMSLPELAAFLIDLLLSTALKVALALLLLAILDFGFQWWKQEQDMRMTTQEVREEMKNLQGDPQVISRRRAAQRQLVLNRLSSTVPKADVVITNPTELAVAVQYDPETMNAPVVVAKGAGVMAQRIRKLALEHGIPIVEKKPLAQALFKEVEINHPVPHQMYSAVAEILAYVYQLKGKSMPTLR